MANRDLLLRWLNDAYAMETAGREMLGEHLRDAKNNPDLEERLRSHLALTEMQGETVAKLIRQLGGEISVIKSGVGTALGIVQGLSSDLFSDQIIKNTLSDIAFEHFEVAAYRGLITAAEELGEPELLEPLRAILAEEMTMAAWLEKELHDNVRTYIRNV